MILLHPGGSKNFVGAMQQRLDDCGESLLFMDGYMNILKVDGRPRTYTARRGRSECVTLSAAKDLGAASGSLAALRMT